ncbi:SMP-30/gluconolactonase/LRE family protein [Butyrivibrio sp. NC2007]|jgi:gluconolactonase|uniref:SMP-30/gluconolactonase/LRE family protein n=1 Tax=Butyrivibrio sp. NC2007 TaxID=1280683 RepID=UPI0003B74DB9|nr:SMP-30/gluconolactonase/LRE family protein [Butyrivibrio sp. NC2007]
MKTYKAEPFGLGKYLLGESPFYDPRTKCRSFVDIIAGKLYIIEAGGLMKQADFGQKIGAAVPSEKAGSYLVAAADGLYVYDGKEISLNRSLKDIYETYHRSNDAKADPAGRLWFGSMAEGEGIEPSGDLYRNEHGRVALMQPDTIIANGMAWSADRTKFYFADSEYHAVFVYDYDFETGNIANRTELIHIDDGVPDGMCIDSEDNLWIAVWGGRRIEKRSSKTGELLALVEVPAEHVSSCCFFGDNLDELFITTSGNELSGDYDGCLFTCKVDEKGLAPDYAMI